MKSIDLNNDDERDYNYGDLSGETTSGNNPSFWINSSIPISYESLMDNISVEVVIVGGGISGITTAYLLAKEGRSVAVIEDGNIGSGETGRTTAHLVNALDDRYFEIEKALGPIAAKLAAESHTAAINMVENIVMEEGIKCDFVRLDGYLFPGPFDTIETIRKEFDATQRAGIETSLVNKMPGIQNEVGEFLKFPNQAQFHPLKYLKALCEKIHSYGGMIFTGTHAKTINGDGIETSEGYKVSAKYVAVATNTPVNNRFVLHTKQAPYRTYVIGAKVLKGKLPKALWWDTGDQSVNSHIKPYHYVRLQPYDHQFDLLIIGGEDHKTGQDDKEMVDRFQNLKIWAQERFPILDIEFKWSGQVMEPVDYLAYIGRNPNDSDNVFVASGDSGNGMTNGTIAAIMIRDLINGNRNRWENIYDPGRINLETTKDFLEENLNVARKYKELFTAGDMEKDGILPVNSGTVIRDGISKLAIYRDEFGELHAYNAMCPHMKCVVHWNNTEKSFDCPCHGSRFTCFGKVVNGPANTDLSIEKVPDDAFLMERIYAQRAKE
jgi:glycine/D-amino acid oxidase-like deaminating enzyme/nitrite reductase/ring-hydroxylating ferredoxin subunit